MRFQTINQCYQTLCKEENQTAISQYLIRSLANQEKIRSLVSGNRVYVDYDSLIAYLKGQPYEYEMKQINAR